MSRPVTILLADDHGLIREMLRQRLEDELDMTVVATVGDGHAALKETLALRPDVVLLDIDMPGLSAFDAARTIREQLPATRIVFLSAFFHDRYIEQALAVEAAGYVTKREPPESVIKAIRTVVGGRVYFSGDVQARIVVDTGGARLARTLHTRVDLLTLREREVLSYIARGMAKKNIARTLGISVKTVEQHCTHIMDKLEIHDRVELARFAIREGLAGT